ncbi:hypothetical protein NC651_027984 [Populus alba x Populus x berolinensis]|nr:hypothetical protein NC651_027984 [Populus alba x Populus x berolinensis]
MDDITVNDAEECTSVRHSIFTSRSFDICQRFNVFNKIKSLRTFLIWLGGRNGLGDSAGEESPKNSLTSLRELIGSRNHRYLTSISRGSSTSPLLNLCEFLTVPKSNSFQRRASLAHLDSCMSVIVHFWKNGAERVAEFRIQPVGRLTNFDVPQHLVDRYRDFKVLNPST